MSSGLPNSFISSGKAPVTETAFSRLEAERPGLPVFDKAAGSFKYGFPMGF
jgi:hypothetical protein